MFVDQRSVWKHLQMRMKFDIWFARSKTVATRSNISMSSLLTDHNDSEIVLYSKSLACGMGLNHAYVCVYTVCV